KATARLPRRHASLLMQLRTKAIPLRRYLHKIGRAKTPKCLECGEVAEETVWHFLFECSGHATARDRLLQAIGPAKMQIAPLLSKPALFPHLFRYIHDTKRFLDTFGDLRET
ncbi:hypothetical protein FA95DRAFT_1464990, partial [Auriscalpium vulgare]